jgi:hypothetical protein
MLKLFNPTPEDLANGADAKLQELFKNFEKAELDVTNGSKLYACKVVERKNLCRAKENLVVNEIQN